MDRRGALIPALVLILIGVFFLLVNLGVLPKLSIAESWPGIVMFVGIMFWLGFIFSRGHDAGLAFVGTIITLIGAFFFLFTLHTFVPGYGSIQWGDQGRLWPAYPMIVGIAFVVLWIAQRFRDGGVLIPAAILLVVGLAGFSFTLGDVTPFRDIVRFWPALLIGLGLVILVRAFTRPNRSVPPPTEMSPTPPTGMNEQPKA
jgi:hypothetical protein